MKPFIGITMNLEEQAARNLNILDQDYGKAVFRAGGVPVPVLGIHQSVPDLVRQLDGFVFTGGDDIHPRFYGEKPIRGVNMALSPDRRTEFEIMLLKAVVKARKPVLAICHGAQLVNVALGGKLYQDVARQIPKSIKHGPAKKGEKVYHPVDIFEGTVLSHIMGNPQIRTRSSHHQSVKNPGRGLRLAAVSADGVIEALESRGRNFLLAVQWHPEKTPDDKHTIKLFEAVVHASRKRP